jgi:hypothetical protein
MAMSSLGVSPHSTKRRTKPGLQTAVRTLINDLMNNKSDTTPETIINEIRQKSAEEAAVAERILEWWERFFAPKCNPKSIRLEFRHAPTGFHPINIASDGKLYLQMTNIRDMMRSKADFPEFNRHLDKIGFVKNPDFPWIQLGSLTNDESLSRFLKLMEWLIERLRKC